MRVVVPFAVGPGSWALAAVKLALRQEGVEARFVHMDTDLAYYELLHGLWRQRETFTVVEHDIVLHPGAIQELADCPEQWCTFPYYCSVGWIVDGLGCTKFSRKMLEQHPAFLDEPFPTCCQHGKQYCGLDRLIAHRANALGMAPHVHSPGVVNLNERWT